MPTYEWICSECKQKTEVVKRVDDRDVPPRACHCGAGSWIRVPSAPAVQRGASWGSKGNWLVLIGLLLGGCMAAPLTYPVGTCLTGDTDDYGTPGKYTYRIVAAGSKGFTYCQGSYFHTYQWYACESTMDWITLSLIDYTPTVCIDQGHKK